MYNRRNETRKSTSDYFLVYNTETEELIGRVMDMHLDGTMLISETPVPVPSTIKCRMVLPEMIGRHKYLHIEAESIWCRQNLRLGWFETGYKIVGLSETDREIINELIDEWTDKKSELTKTPPKPAGIR